MELIHITEINKDIVGYRLARNQNFKSNNITKRALIAMQKKIFTYLTADEKRLMKLAYEDCLGTEKIANEFKCTQQAVRNRLKKLDIDIEKIIDAILSDYKEVLTDEEATIYEYYNCYRYSLSEISKLIGKNRKYISGKLKIIDLKLF